MADYLSDTGFVDEARELLGVIDRINDVVLPVLEESKDVVDRIRERLENSE